MLAAGEKIFQPIFSLVLTLFSPRKALSLMRTRCKNQKKISPSAKFSVKTLVNAHQTLEFLHLQTPPSILGPPKICNICLGHYLELSTPLWTFCDIFCSRLELTFVFAKDIVIFLINKSDDILCFFWWFFVYFFWFFLFFSHYPNHDNFQPNPLLACTN